MAAKKKSAALPAKRPGLPPSALRGLLEGQPEPPARKQARLEREANTPELSIEETPEPGMKKKRKRLKIADSAAKRIKQLPNFQEVHNRLCAGVSCESIARWLQDDLGLATDVGYEGLVRQLYRYRKHIPIDERKGRPVALLHERVKEQNHRVNTLEELNKLYEFQIQRLDKLISIEDRMQQGLMGQTGTELDRAARYLNQIISLKERLGLIKKGAPEVTTDVNVAAAAGAAGGAMAMLMSKYGDNAPDVMSNIGKRLAAAVHRAAAVKPEMASEGTNDGSEDLDPSQQILDVPAPDLKKR